MKIAEPLPYFPRKIYKFLDLLNGPFSRDDFNKIFKLYFHNNVHLSDRVVFVNVLKNNVEKRLKKSTITKKGGGHLLT